MPKRRYLKLESAERQELEQVRDTHPKAYMREKACALLKIADGMSGHAVAKEGILKPRDPDTIYEWVKRYEARGIAGLLVRKGRGRTPAFSPKHEDKEAAKEGLLVVLRRDPNQFGFECARWTLEMIRDHCSWLNLTTDGSLSALFKRLGISYKRGRDYVHSPDPYYEEKRYLIQQAQERAYQDSSFVLLYMDEVTYYRQPTVARAYETSGHQQPLAQRSHRSDTPSRIVAVMNSTTGQVTFLQRNKTTIPCLRNFWYDIRTAYPNAAEIGIVLDNWPVHFHPDVLAPLKTQSLPYPPRLPANWPTEPTAKAKLDNLPIQLFCLPTYASWLNPIEKLWRWLRQDVLHLHRLSDELQTLKMRVAQFLTNFSHGSNELLKYVGLLPN